MWKKNSRDSIFNVSWVVPQDLGCTRTPTWGTRQNFVYLKRSEMEIWEGFCMSLLVCWREQTICYVGAHQNPQKCKNDDANIEWNWRRLVMVAKKQLPPHIRWSFICVLCACLKMLQNIWNHHINEYYVFQFFLAMGGKSPMFKNINIILWYFTRVACLSGWTNWL